MECDQCGAVCLPRKGKGKGTVSSDLVAVVHCVQCHEPHRSPPTAVCGVCGVCARGGTDSDDRGHDELPIHAGCMCHGGAGLAHLACKIKQAVQLQVHSLVCWCVGVCVCVCMAWQGMVCNPPFLPVRVSRPTLTMWHRVAPCGTVETLFRLPATVQHAPAQQSMGADAYSGWTVCTACRNPFTGRMLLGLAQELMRRYVTWGYSMSAYVLYGLNILTLYPLPCADKSRAPSWRVA